MKRDDSSREASMTYEAADDSGSARKRGVTSVLRRSMTYEAEMSGPAQEADVRGRGDL